MTYSEQFGTGQTGYQPNMPSTPQPPPRYQIAFVNGETGVDEFPMGPNSSIILADSTDSKRLWLCTTDELGRKTKRKIKYTIEDEGRFGFPGESEMQSILDRLQKLEDIVNEQRTNTGRNSKTKSANGSAESES